MSYNYRQINYEVMVDTSNRCKTMQELKEAIEHSIANQFVIAEEEKIDQPLPDKVTTKYQQRDMPVKK